MVKFFIALLIILTGCGGSVNGLHGRRITDYVIHDEKDTLQILSFPPYIVAENENSSGSTGDCSKWITKYKLVGADSVSVDELPKPIKSRVPKYPEIARRDNLEGDVCVRLWVNKDGTIRKVKAIVISDEIFVEPALIAAIDWTLSPAIKDGKPIEVSVFLPFKFRLNPSR